MPTSRQAVAPWGEGAVRDVQSLPEFREGEIVAPDARPDPGESLSLQLVALAAVLAQHDRAIALDDAGEQAARTDGGELLRRRSESPSPRFDTKLRTQIRSITGTNPW